MKIIVTGATGFIGSALCKILRENGHDVIPLSIRAGSIPDYDGDVAFHLAHDYRIEQRAELIAWYQKLEEGWRPQFNKQIFISSYSARADAQSFYGSTKYKIEQQFLKNGHSIIRPGLVLGAGGTYGAMLKLLKLSPIIPVPGGKNIKVPYISLSHLCNLMSEFPSGESNFFSSQLISLQDLLQASAQKHNLKRYFVPIPSRMTLWGLKLFEATGLKLPITSDNLIGLLINQQQIHFSSSKDEQLDFVIRNL